MNKRFAYFSLGIIFFSMGGLLAFVAFKAKDSLPDTSLLLFALSIMSFCISYLYPQFIQKDERMKLIRQKGMFYSYFAMIFYYIILSASLHFHFIALDATQVLNILISLHVSTVFISLVILSKIHWRKLRSAKPFRCRWSLGCAYAGYLKKLYRHT